MTKRWSQIEAEMKSLASQGKDSLYRRLQLSHELLTDDKWLASHNGSLDIGQEYLAQAYFSEWQTVVPLSVLYALFEKFDRATWEKYRFDVGAMRILYNESITAGNGEQPARKRTVVTAQEHKELQDRLTQVTAEVATSKMVQDSLRHDADLARQSSRDMEQRCRELERENAELRGRIAELERIVSRELVAV